MSVAVRATGLTKTYQDGVRRVEVLKGIDLAVEPGEMVAIVGPSGSGKSTLLHLLGALDRPDEGSAEIGGSSLADFFQKRTFSDFLRQVGHQVGKTRQPLQRLRVFNRELRGWQDWRRNHGPAALAGFRNRMIGFVFQFHQLLPDFTALENVMLPGRIAGREPSQVLARARGLLVEVGLIERLDHFPSQLSGGERQRVALCRALALEPPLLLADEPTGNLDPESGETVFALLLALQARHGTTGILVTHNPEIARRCTRTLRLDGGVLHPY